LIAAQLRIIAAGANAATTAGEHASAAVSRFMLCLLTLNYPSEEGKLRRVADGILYRVASSVKKNRHGSNEFLSAYFFTYAQKTR
jgi:hypothetical protein